MGKKLNPRQAKFVEFYVSTGNATESAKLAGYKEKTAYSMGGRLLKNVEVAKQINKRRGELEGKLQKRTEITREKLLDELAFVAFSDLKNLMTWDNEKAQFVESAEIEVSVSRALKKIKSREFTKYEKGGSPLSSTLTLEVENYDKLRAIEMIAKLLGYWVDKNEHTGKDGQPIAVTPVDEKALTAKVMELMARTGRKFE
jgi:phage terminase small subunit